MPTESEGDPCGGLRVTGWRERPASADWASGEGEQRRGADAYTGVGAPRPRSLLPEAPASPSLEVSRDSQAPAPEWAFWGRPGLAAWPGARAGVAGGLARSWPGAAVWARDAMKPPLPRPVGPVLTTLLAQATALVRRRVVHAAWQGWTEGLTVAGAGACVTPGRPFGEADGPWEPGGTVRVGETAAPSPRPGAG